LSVAVGVLTPNRLLKNQGKDVEMGYVVRIVV
jgi:hypothetical protein